MKEININDTGLQEEVLKDIENKSDKQAFSFIAENIENINNETLEFLNNEDYGNNANNIIKEELKERFEELDQKMNSVDVNDFTVETKESLQQIEQQQNQAEKQIEQTQEKEQVLQI